MNSPSGRVIVGGSSGEKEKPGGHENSGKVTVSNSNVHPVDGGGTLGQPGSGTGHQGPGREAVLASSSGTVTVDGTSEVDGTSVEMDAVSEVQSTVIPSEVDSTSSGVVKSLAGKGT